MMVSFVAMLAGVVLNYFIPATAFAYITSVASGCGLSASGLAPLDDEFMVPEPDIVTRPSAAAEPGIAVTPVSS